MAFEYSGNLKTCPKRVSIKVVALQNNSMFLFRLSTTHIIKCNTQTSSVRGRVRGRVWLGIFDIPHRANAITFTRLYTLCQLSRNVLSLEISPMHHSCPHPINHYHKACQNIFTHRNTSSSSPLPQTTACHPQSRASSARARSRMTAASSSMHRGR